MAFVVLEERAAQDVEDLPPVIHGRVLKLVERLAHWPSVSGVRPLSGNLAGHYRLRTGDYRLQFRVAGDRVIVEKIGHRDRFYEKEN